MKEKVLFMPANVFSLYEHAGHLNKMILSELLAKLEEEKSEDNRALIRQTLMVTTLPHLAHEMKLWDIARCLKVMDTDVQRYAISLLEKLLLGLTYM